MKKVFLALMLIICGSACLFIDRAGATNFDKAKQTAAATVSAKTGINLNTNYKQQQAEKELKEKGTYDIRHLYEHSLLIKEDKKGYKNGEDSVYGQILSLINSGATLEAQYAQKVKKLLDTLANVKLEDLSASTVETFKKMKIIIPDSDFDKISDELKDIIFLINSY